MRIITKLLLLVKFHRNKTIELVFHESSIYRLSAQPFDLSKYYSFVITFNLSNEIRLNFLFQFQLTLIQAIKQVFITFVCYLYSTRTLFNYNNIINMYQYQVYMHYIRWNQIHITSSNWWLMCITNCAWTSFSIRICFT